MSRRRHPLALALAVVLTFLGTAAARAQAAPGSPRRQIEPLLAEMTRAANAHDTDRFLATYLHDSTLVMVFNGSVVTGYDSVRALQLRWWNNGRSDVVYRMQGPARFTVLGTGAVVVTHGLHAQRTDSSGVLRQSELAVMSVWQKRPEGWRIVAVHESTNGR